MTKSVLISPGTDEKRSDNQGFSSGRCCLPMSSWAPITALWPLSTGPRYISDCSSGWGVRESPKAAECSSDVFFNRILMLHEYSPSFLQLSDEPFRLWRSGLFHMVFFFLLRFFLKEYCEFVGFEWLKSICGDGCLLFYKSQKNLWHLLFA